MAEVRKLSEGALRVQEEERLRIARDLHDGVGQAVSALQIELQLAGVDDVEQRSPHLQAAVRLAEEILGEIRNAVFALRPAELAERGLEQALRDCVERFELRARLPASFRAEGDLRRVPERAAAGLLRILQEALTNIGRHSGASEVGVMVRSADNALCLRVTDDGRGFETTAAPRGSGIRGMQERAAFLGGRLEISSGPGQGTQVEVTLPLRTEDHERNQDPESSSLRTTSSCAKACARCCATRRTSRCWQRRATASRPSSRQPRWGLTWW